jgi:cobalt-zinc-cadmium efflux system protein
MAGAHDDESHKHDHDGHDHAGHDHDHHGHEHSHHQHGQSADLRALIVALVLTLLITGVELVGAALYQSLALTADGWHMFSDAGSLALAVFATMIARRPRSARKTFGYHRLEVLAALANGVLLAAASVLIVHEAWVRWWSPSDVKGWQVAIVGAVSLIVNLLSAYLLHRRGHDNMNVRAALAHILGDVLGSCAAIAAGLVVQLTGSGERIRCCRSWCPCCCCGVHGASSARRRTFSWRARQRASMHGRSKSPSRGCPGSDPSMICTSGPSPRVSRR